MENTGGGTPLCLSFVGSFGNEFTASVLRIVDTQPIWDANLVTLSHERVFDVVLSATESQISPDILTQLSTLCTEAFVVLKKTTLSERQILRFRGSLSSHRVIVPQLPQQDWRLIVSSILDRMREKFEFVEANFRKNIFWADFQTDLTLTAINRILSDMIEPEYQYTLLRGGLALRRPRALVFVGDVAKTSMAREELEDVLAHRGYISVGVFGSSENEASASTAFHENLRKHLLTINDVLVICGDYGNESNKVALPSFLPASVPVLNLGRLSPNLSGPDLNVLDLSEVISAVATSRNFAADAEQLVDDLSKIPFVLDEIPSECVHSKIHFTLQHALVAATNRVDIATVSNKEYVVTVVTKSTAASIVPAVTNMLESHGKSILQGIRTLSSTEQKILPPTADAATLLPLNCWELYLHFEEVPTPEQLTTLRADLKSLADETKCDLALLHNSFWRLHPRLAVFDMDSTLVQQECIDEMAAVAGVGDEVKKITLRAMNGELDFEAALKARVGLLRGLHAEDLFKTIRNNLEYTPGASFMAAVLRSLGVTMAVLSGGFTSIITTVRDFLGLHHAHANELEVSDEKLTGQLAPGSPIVDAKAKLGHLRGLAAERHVVMQQTIAVGDGANDLLMIGAAGLGVAFVAKPHVQKKALYHINHVDLTPLLYLIGVSRAEAVQMLSLFAE